MIQLHLHQGKPLCVATRKEDGTWHNHSNLRAKQVKLQSLEDCVYYLQGKLANEWYIFDGETLTFYLSHADLEHEIITTRLQSIFTFDKGFSFEQWAHKDHVRFVLGKPNRETLDKGRRTYVYLRVSTDKQNNDNQRHSIETYVERNGIKVDNWVEEIVSGAKKANDRKLGALIDNMNAGDTLIVAEFSRLGRLLFDIVHTVDVVLNKKRSRIVCLKENQTFGDNPSRDTIMMMAFGISAQFERERTSQRTLEGLQAARRRGVKLGRPKKPNNPDTSKCDPHKAKIKQYIDVLGLSVSKTARLIGVHRVTLTTWLKKQGNDTSDMYEQAIQKRIKEIKTFLTSEDVPKVLYQQGDFWVRNVSYLKELKQCQYTYEEIAHVTGLDAGFFRQLIKHVKGYEN
jgi:DNA invertase Pin-like site-specific DNA recombinase